MTRKFRKQPASDVLQVEIGGHVLSNSMALSELFVVLALYRRGPSTSAEVAREVSTWLDKPLRPDGLNRALRMVVGLGWARCLDRTYAIAGDGIEVVRGCHVAFMRMLGGAGRCPDANVREHLIDDLERSRS